MFWQKKEITYNILVPPLDKSPQALDSEEAKEYFDWYMDQIPKRIEYLSAVSGCNMDMSFHSLISLWGWFLKVAEIETTPEEKLDVVRKELKHKPESFVEYVISDLRNQLSLQTEYILRDIAMYVGQVFVTYSKNITWGYHTDTDKDSFANIPLLQGFEDKDFMPPFPMEFEPVHMVTVQACNLFDGTQNQKDLYDLCQHWIKLIPK